jgi:hypothetical protein
MAKPTRLILIDAHSSLVLGLPISFISLEHDARKLLNPTTLPSQNWHFTELYDSHLLTLCFLNLTLNQKRSRVSRIISESDKDINLLTSNN